MKHVKLDRVDKIILRELQDNGRITNVELAQKAGISAPPCLRRVRALEEAGYIRGYHADIVGEKLGYGMISFMLVSISRHSEVDLVNFVNMVESWPEVRFCYMLTGDADFLVKVVTKDLASFQNFLTSRMISAPNVAQVKSLPAVRRTNYHAGFPIPEDLKIPVNED
jgi:DNA-binding Lrp family transcriptional regulator